MAGIRAGRRSVRVSNLDKVLFPDDGITKGDLIDYYLRIAPAMLPHIAGRLLTFERYPDGIGSKRFFQKDAPRHFPAWIDRQPVPKRGGGKVSHVVARDAATLVYLADQACITFHASPTTRDRLEHPDQMVFDLDPSADDFAAIRRNALRLRSLLEDLAMTPVVKTSGSRGLHLIVPLDASDPIDDTRAAARRISALFASMYPDELTIEQRKENRRGRIFVDWLRNGVAQTAVAAYSVRARARAPVAAPLDWSEVGERSLKPDRYTMSDAAERAQDDPWKGWRRRARSLKEPLKRLTRMEAEAGDRI